MASTGSPPVWDSRAEWKTTSSMVATRTHIIASKCKLIQSKSSVPFCSFSSCLLAPESWDSRHVTPHPVLCGAEPQTQNFARAS